VVVEEGPPEAVIAFAINCGAYSSESLRAALLSVDKGQIEAAHSLGLTNAQTLRRVTIPQAVVVALPTMTNGFIGNFHGTSLVFVISVVDILAKAKLTGANAYRYFEVFVAVALIYWALCIVIERLGKYLEKKFALPGAAQTV
jgi:ABC-type amino acid transport system permease subunit